MTPRLMPSAVRILRVTRVVAHLDRAAAFYRDALGFRMISHGLAERALLALLGVPESAADGACEAVLRLGHEEIALTQFGVPSQPYPTDSRSNDLWFQHLAIVVHDMDAAYSHLCSNKGWEPISRGGPQTLPPSNGGVRCFKFRDPDRHPLELLWLPPGEGRALWHAPAAPASRASLAPPASSPVPRRDPSPFAGIDHSAISVASAERSLAFYDALGMTIASRSLNAGPAQSHLDGLEDAHVRVTSLRPASPSGPGLELLAYQPPGRASTASSIIDVATDWVTIQARAAAATPPCALRDPDGHRLLLVPQ